jgi:hypothetical protein
LLTCTPEFTDGKEIISTAKDIDQTSSAGVDEAPNQTPPATVITAIDGEIVTEVANSTSSSARRQLARSIPGRFGGRDLTRRALPGGYNQIFKGTCDKGAACKDASIEGTAYLTYTLVSNTTDTDTAVAQCLSFCDRVKGCSEYPLLSVCLNPCANCLPLLQDLSTYSSSSTISSLTTSSTSSPT